MLRKRGVDLNYLEKRKEVTGWKLLIEKKIEGSFGAGILNNSRYIRLVYVIKLKRYMFKNHIIKVVPWEYSRPYIFVRAFLFYIRAI